MANQKDINNQDSKGNGMSAEQPPEEFTKFYPSTFEAKKIRKPLLCYLLDIGSDNNHRATMVMKPIKVKYGSKWFDVGREQRYFINYQQVMNFGKHYAYLCQYGNAIGALSFHKYPEIEQDANQVWLMTNQHAVEVFKKHKGISPKLVMVLAIALAIAIIGVVITSQIAIGQNNAINVKTKQVETLTVTNTNLMAENNSLKAQLGIGQ